MSKNKYVARIPATSGDRKWRYFYSNEEYQAYLKNKSAVQNQQLKNNLGYKLGNTIKKNQDKIKAFGKQVSDTNKNIQNTNAKIQNHTNKYNVGSQIYKTQQTVKKHREAEQAKRNAMNEEILNYGKARQRSQQKQAQQSPEYQQQLKKQNAKNAINKEYYEKQKAYEQQKGERAARDEYTKKQKAYEQQKGERAARDEYTKKQKATAETNAKRAAESAYERSDEYKEARNKKAAVDAAKRTGDSDYQKRMAQQREAHKQALAEAKKEKDPVERGKKAISALMDKVEQSLNKAKSKTNQKKTIKENSGTFTERDAERIKDAGQYMNAKGLNELSPTKKDKIVKVGDKTAIVPSKGSRYYEKSVNEAKKQIKEQIKKKKKK